MSDMKQIPFNIRVEKAKNEMRYTTNMISAKYDIPGEVVALILESVLAEENQQRISLICEQITEAEAVEPEEE